MDGVSLIRRVEVRLDFAIILLFYSLLEFNRAVTRVSCLLLCRTYDMHMSYFSHWFLRYSISHETTEISVLLIHLMFRGELEELGTPAASQNDWNKWLGIPN